MRASGYDKFQAGRDWNKKKRSKGIDWSDPTVVGSLSQLALLDTDASNIRILKVNEDLTGDYYLYLVGGDADRTITLSGNPTLADWFDQAVKVASSPTFAGVTLGNTGLHILDTNDSHDLIIKPGSDITADKTLTITTGDADRTITLSGNPTLSDWFDQAVKVASSPQFVGITLTGNLTISTTCWEGLGAAKGRIIWTDAAVDTADFEVCNLDLDSPVFIAQSGIITKEGTNFLHDFSYGDNGVVTPYGLNTFLGSGAGNLTLGATAANDYESSWNYGIGAFALSLLTKGYNNFGGGYSALLSLTEGYGNVAVGGNSLGGLTTGYRNVGIGDLAGAYYSSAGGGINKTSNSSIYIGYNTQALASGDTNEIVIGDQALGKGSNTATLGNDSITDTYLKGNVLIQTTKYLGIGPAAGRLVWTDATVDTAVFSDCYLGVGVTPTSILTTLLSDATAWPSFSGVYPYTPYPHELYIANPVMDTVGSWAGICLKAGQTAGGTEINFARIAAIRTAGYLTDIAFATRSAAGVFSEKMRLTDVGNLGLGTTLPLNNVAGGTADYTGGGLHIYAAATARLILEGTAATLELIDVDFTTANGRIMGLANSAGLTKFFARNQDTTVLNDYIISMTHSNGHTGFGIQTALAQIHAKQASTTGAVPVSALEQLDTDQPFTKYIGTSTGAVTGSLVDAVDFPAPGPLIGYVQHYVEDSHDIPDSVYYTPFYGPPTTSNALITAVTVADTVTETTLYTYSVPANTLAVSRIKILVGTGVFSTQAAAHTWTVRLKLNGVTIATLVSAGAGVVTAGPWHIQFWCTVRTIGALGTISIHGDAEFEDASDHYDVASTVINTTAAVVFTFTAQASVANASTTLTCNQAFPVRVLS